MGSDERDGVAPGGCWIPPDVMRDRELTMAQKVVFGRIRSLAEQRGFCYAGNDRLARELGVSERQVRRHVGSLVSAGYLRRQLERDGSGVVTDRRLYPLNPQRSQPEDASVPTRGDTSVPTPRDREDGRTGSGPADGGPEDASVPTPPDREDASVLQGGDASVRGVGTHASTKKRGTAVQSESTTDAGAHPRGDSDNGAPDRRPCSTAGCEGTVPPGEPGDTCYGCRTVAVRASTNGGPGTADDGDADPADTTDADQGDDVKPDEPRQGKQLLQEAARSLDLAPTDPRTGRPELSATDPATSDQVDVLRQRAEAQELPDPVRSRIREALREGPTERSAWELIGEANRALARARRAGEEEPGEERRCDCGRRIGPTSQRCGACKRREAAGAPA